MEFPEDLKYSKEHEWVRVEGDHVTVGITAFAQDELGEIVSVEVPTIGRSLNQNDTFGVVESVKTVGDMFAPVSGEVINVNTALEAHPEYVNTDPYGTGWMFVLKLANPSELDALMDAGQYRSMIGT
jgi:glycine cleavage system H protein